MLWLTVGGPALVAIGLGLKAWTYFMSWRVFVWYDNYCYGTTLKTVVSIGKPHRAKYERHEVARLDLSADDADETLIEARVLAADRMGQLKRMEAMR